MPQTGYTPIQIYSSSTPTNAPSAGNLTNDTKGSELAINIADKNLFFKDSSNVVNTVPIRQSGAASDGWLSSTDWNTFNNKQPAGTYVTSVTGTAPVVSSGGTTPAISMAAATTSVNGYLTSTDWNTFNGKQAALVSGSNIKTVSGTTLLGSGDLGTIGVGYGGTGTSTAFTAGSIVFAGSSGVYSQDNSNLFWDDTNNFLGLGTASPTNYVQLGASSVIGQDINSLYIGSNFKNNGQRITANYAAQTYWDQTNGAVVFRTAASGAAGSAISFTETMRIHASGGVSIGNTTDPGATNLSVTGSTQTDGLVSHAGTGGAYQSNKFNFQWTGSAALWVDTTNIGNIAIVSDIRIKNILGDLKGSLARVMQWQTVLYEYNGKHDLWPVDGNVYAGFIAGQLADITPSAVNGAKEAMTSDGKIQPQTLNPIPMLAELTNALQEQQMQIEQLKAEIAALKG